MWSSSDIESLNERESFFRVGYNRKIFRFLCGAPRSWSSENPDENETIFNCTYRITGTPENIRLALQQHNPPYDEETINECINDSFTKYNYQTTKKQEYDDEINKYREKMVIRRHVKHCPL
jgi:hypothetical protein